MTKPSLKVEIHTKNLRLNTAFTDKEKLHHRGWYYRLLKKRRKK